jgi:hypothetical protein
VYDPNNKETKVRLWLFGLNNYFWTVRYEDAGAADNISFAVNLLNGAALEWWRLLELMAVREEPAREEEIPPNRRLFETLMVAETRARVRLLQ